MLSFKWAKFDQAGRVTKATVSTVKELFQLDAPTAVAVALLMLASIVMVGLNQEVQSKRNATRETQKFLDPYDIREAPMRRDRIVLGY